MRLLLRLVCALALLSAFLARPSAAQGLFTFDTGPVPANADPASYEITVPIRVPLVPSGVSALRAKVQPFYTSTGSVEQYPGLSVGVLLHGSASVRYSLSHQPHGVDSAAFETLVFGGGGYFAVTSPSYPVDSWKKETPYAPITLVWPAAPFQVASPPAAGLGSAAGGVAPFHVMWLTAYAAPHMEWTFWPHEPPPGEWSDGHAPCSWSDEVRVGLRGSVQALR